MAVKKAEVIFVGDAASLVRASRQASDAVARSERQITSSAGRMDQSFARSAKSAAKFAATSAGVASVSIAITKVASSTIDFDRSMRNVNSIAQESEGQFKSLEKQVLSLAGKTAQAPDTLAKGLYDLVSSGFNAKQSMTILASSARAATAGLTTTEVATAGVAAVLNAYHLKATDAAKVSDILFQTVNRGVITFDELAQHVGTVLPFAASLGVNLNQVGAAISTMTKQGISGELSITFLKNAMVAFLKPSDGMATALKKTGYESGEALVKAKGFQGALEAVRSTTDGSKKAMAALFPNIRSLTAGLALTGKNSRTAAADIAAFKDVNGATATALSQQSKSISYQWNKIKAEVSAAAIKTGFAVIQAVGSMSHAISEFVARNRAAVHLFTTGVSSAFQGLIRTARGVVEFFTGAFTLDFRKMWLGLKDMFGGYAKQLAGAVRAAGGVLEAAFGSLATKAIKKVRGYVGSFYNLGKDIVTAIVHGIGAAASGIGHALSNAFHSAEHAVTSLGGLIGDGIGKKIGGGVHPAGGGSSRSLMGAQPALAPFAAIGSTMGLSVSSGRRPGAITASGNVSYHSSGEAIDEAGAPASMMRFFKYMKSQFGSRLAELIYTPGGVGIKDGHPFRYTGAVAAEHFDHVHVALDTGKPGVGDGHGRVHRALMGDGIGRAGLINLWRKAGGPSSKADVAAAVALAESGGNPGSLNKNSNGTVDRGLWQINSIWGGLSTFDQLANARAAVSISKRGSNWHPWVTFNTGAYKRFLGGAVNYKNVKATVLDAGPSLSDRQSTAGSRLVNQIAAPLLGGKSGVHALSGTQQRLGGAIDQGDVLYGQAQRRFDLSDEDLGTPEGRQKHISELKALQRMKIAQMARQKKRAAAIKKEISKYKKLIAAINKRLKGKNRIRGVEAAKIRERRRTYDDAVVDLQAELLSLTNEITDTGIDLDELGGDILETANTPDNAVDDSSGGSGAGPGVGDSGGNAGGDTGQQDLIDAINAQTQAMADLQKAVDEQNHKADAIMATENFTLVKGIADILGGYIVGSGVAGRSLMPSSGVRFRV